MTATTPLSDAFSTTKHQAASRNVTTGLPLPEKAGNNSVSSQLQALLVLLTIKCDMKTLAFDFKQTSHQDLNAVKSNTDTLQG